jgi:hypothetical protein
MRGGLIGCRTFRCEAVLTSSYQGVMSGLLV